MHAIVWVTQLCAEVFPAIADALKTEGADEAWNAEGLVPKAIRMLKVLLPCATHLSHPDVCQSARVLHSQLFTFGVRFCGKGAVA